MIRGVWLIIRKSMRQHLFSTTVTLLSVALAAGLVMSVFGIQRQAQIAFTGGELGFDAVVGARGSPLQLVLNTVFHLETSPGNIPWAVYTALRDNTPGVRFAIPYATGDNYYGFRIVGTTGQIFTEFEFQAGKAFAVQPGGRYFDEGYREAVIGSFVAQKTGLVVGDTINPYHGLAFDESAKHPEEYVVVGIMEPTNSPSDRVVWIPIEGIFRMEGHVLRGTGEEYTPEAGQAIPDEHKEVSAVLLKLAGPMVGWRLEQQINRQGKAATIAYPVAVVMLDLFQKLGWVNLILELVAYLVVLVSAAAILASIYNTINERRREFAILRALGARRRIVFAAIVGEAGAIGFLGALMGYAVYAVILAVAAIVVREQTGVVLDVWRLHAVHVYAPLGITALGAVAGLIPAAKAYSTDVAENLSPST